MKSNEVNDPKVWYELSKGVALEAMQNTIQNLWDDYREKRDKLEEMGFNADMLNLEPKEVVQNVLPKNEEATVQALLTNGGVNKAGLLFKVGVVVANSRVVFEEGGMRRQVEDSIG